MNIRRLFSAIAFALAAIAPSAHAQYIPATAWAPANYPGYEAWNAVDGNWESIWTSGTFAPASIDIRLPGTYVVSGVQLNAVMWPNNGFAEHIVYGRTLDGGYVWLGQIDAVVSDRDWFWLPNSVPVPFNAITIFTPYEFTSWVGWREIYAYGSPYVPPPPPPPPEIQPSYPGDIVGRDLGSTGGAPFGHIGFFDGENVMQVMNEYSVVQSVSYNNFRSQTTPWDAIHTNIPGFSVYSCYQSTCNFLDQFSTSDRSTFTSRKAMAERAHQIRTIGADYTITAYAASADPRMYDRLALKYYPAQRGTYRCDTFIADIFAFTWTPYGNYRMPGTGTYLRIERVTYHVPASWNVSMESLFQPGTLPVTLYNRFKGF